MAQTTEAIAPRSTFALWTARESTVESTTKTAPKPCRWSHIEPVDEEARQLWDAAIALADELPARGWALVGGLMVQLHAYRHGQAGVRATVDIDILADSRQQPRSLTEVVAQRLLELKFEVAQQTGLIGPPTVYRFERGARSSMYWAPTA